MLTNTIIEICSTRLTTALRRPECVRNDWKWRMECYAWAINNKCNRKIHKVDKYNDIIRFVNYNWLGQANLIICCVNARIGNYDPHLDFLFKKIRIDIFLHRVNYHFLSPIYFVFSSPIIYICGSTLSEYEGPENPEERKISETDFARENLSCQSKVELPFYSIDFLKPVCIYCGTEETTRTLQINQAAYPKCKGCELFRRKRKLITIDDPQNHGLLEYTDGKLENRVRKCVGHCLFLRLFNNETSFWFTIFGIWKNTYLTYGTKTYYFEILKI